jgi:putative PIN family toxin of toxin-antitoxin system
VSDFSCDPKAAEAPLRIVLDTNVVLDWLVFDDPRFQALSSAIENGHFTVLTHNRALAELQRVLSYPQFGLDASRQDALLEIYRSNSSPYDPPDSKPLPPGFPRCRDSDDDHFVALAFRTRATLVSRDKAVLKLKKRAARFGIGIIDEQQLIGLIPGQADFQGR